VINEQSLRNLERAFHKALRAHLVRATGDVCDITPMVFEQPRDKPGGKVFLITLSSFVFRLLMMYRITESPATCAYYVSAAGTQTLDGVFAEAVNMCAGALNRELSEGFPHLAMSTPDLVSSQCVGFMDDLKPQYLSSCVITINSSLQIQATLCLCCSAPIEIAASTAANHVEESVGELELF
jgi:hypothetical protein